MTNNSMPTPIDISLTRDKHDVSILVETARADSLYTALRDAGLSPTAPQDAVFLLVRIYRTSEGRVVREDKATDSSIELTDSDNKTEAVVEAWLAKQT